MMRKNRKTRIIILALFIAISVVFIQNKPEDTELKIRSSDLQKITEKDGQTEKTQFVDQNGKVMVAANLGYAISITEKTDCGLLTKYFDEEGKPVCRSPGYYAVLREYDDNGDIIRTVFLNEDGNPCVTKEGYASEERDYDENKRLIESRYFDTDGKPICTPRYGYSMTCEYDDNGNTRVTLKDTEGKPIMTEAGYASFICRYGTLEGMEGGTTEEYFYFDEDSKPVALSLGQYGIRKKYNKFGQGTVITYLDANGEPSATGKGYTTVVRTFGADNNVKTEQYFDEKGNPFPLDEGQYGIAMENGRTIYLGKDGKPVFNLRNLLYNYPWIVILLAIVAVILSVIATRKLNIFFLAVCIAVIVYLTMMYREGGETGRVGWLGYYTRFFTDDIARTDILKNIWLFIPLGAILYKLCPKTVILIMPIFMSALIEAIQLLTGIGICELDDIISNSIGGLIGFHMGELAKKTRLGISSRKQMHSA